MDYCEGLRNQVSKGAMSECMSNVLCVLCCIHSSKMHLCSGGMYLRVVVISKIIRFLEWVRYIQVLPIAQHCHNLHIDLYLRQFQWGEMIDSVRSIKNTLVTPV